VFLNIYDYPLFSISLMLVLLLRGCGLGLNLDFFVFTNWCIDWLSCQKLLASNSITEWGVAADFATADIHSVKTLLQIELKWTEGCSNMALSIAEGLFLTHSTATPVVVLGGEYRVLYL
jgi:hypothetical protein